MTKILHSLHPDALTSGGVKLDGTPLEDVPHLLGLYDWRLALPRTIQYDGHLFRENGGSFIDADAEYSCSQARSELARQKRSVRRRVPDPRVWLNCETYPSWIPTDALTKATATERFAGAKQVRRRAVRVINYEYEIAGLEWFHRVISTLRDQGLKVGAYEPCPDWCEKTPGLCYHVGAMLDFALVPLYVHKGYDGGGLYPTAWYANQWARRIARYRRHLPGVELVAVAWPMLDVKGQPGRHTALSEPYRKVQALCAKNEGLDLVLWDHPAKQEELRDAVDTLAVWRAML